MIDLWLIAGLITLLIQGLDALLGMVVLGREATEMDGGHYALDIPFED
ncbi:MAG: hypothetical protein JXN59_09705 [Anaerolineae bacterium]|nr:hypothetical protein [Anaerolineae bacterium]